MQKMFIYPRTVLSLAKLKLKKNLTLEITNLKTVKKKTDHETKYLKLFSTVLETLNELLKTLRTDYRAS